MKWLLLGPGFPLLLLVAAGASLVFSVLSLPALTERPAVVITVTSADVWHRTCANFDLVDQETGAAVAVNQQSCWRWKE